MQHHKSFHRSWLGRGFRAADLVTVLPVSNVAPFVRQPGELGSSE